MASSYSTMEKEVQPPTPISTTPTPTPTLTLVAAPTTPKSPKHRGPLSAMIAALFVSEVRSSSKKASKKPADTGPGFFSKILCGLHPLHHAQFEDDMPHQAPLPIRHKSESFHDVLLPPPSPDHLVEEGMSSRYASAEDLQALDSEGDDRKEEVEEEEAGDTTIDMQAEEFIANFYQQMRLQRSDSVEQS